MKKLFPLLATVLFAGGVFTSACAQRPEYPNNDSGDPINLQHHDYPASNQLNGPPEDTGRIYGNSQGIHKKPADVPATPAPASGEQ